jgi:stage V sporulation protein R
VEKFIDACLSLENLIDPHSPFIRRSPEPGKPQEPKPDERRDKPRDREGLPEGQGKFASKDYMDPYINPPDVLEKERQDRKEKQEARDAARSFPERPQRDVLLFLLQYAPLKEWQHDVLAIIRDEAYYFAPQGQTKIMNEGWASYWHSTIMTRHGLTDAEVIDYADHHSGTMAMSPQRLNPYKVGIELFRDIEDRWNRGRFGEEWEACESEEEKLRWNKELGLGREKIFEVRNIYNDLTFIDAFLTEDFCRKHKMFSFAYNDSSGNYEIASREFQAIKKQLLTSLTNHGRPFIYVKDGNYANRGELYLQHDFQGVELKRDYANDTLVNLHAIWGRPVHIQTVIDEKLSALSYDGRSHDVRPA